MIRFELETEYADIGHYSLLWYINDEYKGMMSITDNTNDVQQQHNKERHIKCAYSYEVNYISGSSMQHGFDYDINHCRHKDENGKPMYGYNGTARHTLEDVIVWCKEYVASLYIIDAKKEFEKLQERVAISNWFMRNGFVGKDYKDPLEIE